MHLVQTMAYVGQEPWHGLGNRLSPSQSIEVWADRAGMNWTIESSEVRFVAGSSGIGTIHAFPDQKVLYRSDNKLPLSVVSTRYQVVQPRQILEFYRDLTEIGGFELETAGVLNPAEMLAPVVDRLFADPVLLRHLGDRRLVRLAQDRDHLLFRKPALLHDFLSPLEAILSSFNWSENHRAGHHQLPR
ncbi:hypothetical protein BLKGLAD_13850 [Burkholderia gladioli pv. gladioli]